MKRAFDVTISLTALLLLAPLLVAIAAAIFLSMGAPVFFHQQRPGLHGQPFHILKFRTMREGAAADAERLTPVGRFLRQTSLDELPELINILKGEMSLVGPRPLLMQYLPLYSPEQARRHEVRPGLTGWAQVNGRNRLDWPERFAHDVWYVDNRSFLLDLRILLMTVTSALRRDGINAEGEATMTPFLGNDPAPQREPAE
ncbi:sugar transferase [Rhodobacteraceae bacterium NNCM2]|nr:sugar transferase [Coraliihabitans acroporae]